MAERGLGTGLGALFGEAALEALPNDFIYLPTAKIEPRKDQPRSVFDEEALADLAESIKEHGVLQPLTVRRLDGGYYQIIAGERRWRASRIAGLKEVPARVIDADDRKATELALVENLQRQDLNPVEEALGYKTLIQEYNMTQEEVAQGSANPPGCSKRAAPPVAATEPVGQAGEWRAQRRLGKDVAVPGDGRPDPVGCGGHRGAAADGAGGRKARQEA
jgi:hypothetical protein